MRARTFVALASLSLALGAGCTAFIAAELSGKQGTDAGSPLGDCFKLAANQCGQCIENSCENPNGSPPVSLATVCSEDQYATIITDLGTCVSDPRFSNYYCENVFQDGGAYAQAIDTPAAAENNLKKCISDNCVKSCSECNVPIPTCGNETIELAEAGTCGTCIDNAMNRPGSPCQTWVLQQGCYEDTSGAIAKCAPPSGTCATADCTGLQNPDSNLVDAAASLYTCLWQQCQGSCPNP